LHELVPAGASPTGEEDDQQRFAIKHFSVDRIAAHRLGGGKGGFDTVRELHALIGIGLYGAEG